MGCPELKQVDPIANWARPGRYCIELVRREMNV